MSTFRFKHFSVQQGRSALKVGTDAMLLGALIEPVDFRRGLDVGTGTGVLSLMVAQKCMDVHITALDIDDESLIDCAMNFNASPWSDRLNCLNCDILDFNSEDPFDLIFSNPPFYQNSLLSTDERVAASKHAGQLSYERLFEQVTQLLSLQGSFWVILPGEYDYQVMQIAKEKGLHAIHRIQIEGVPGRHTRTVFQFSKSLQERRQRKLLVRETDGGYTQEYTILTSDYHDRKLL